MTILQQQSYKEGLHNGQLTMLIVMSALKIEKDLCMQWALYPRLQPEGKDATPNFLTQKGKSSKCQ